MILGQREFLSTIATKNKSNLHLGDRYNQIMLTKEKIVLKCFILMSLVGTIVHAHIKSDSYVKPEHCID